MTDNFQGLETKKEEMRKHKSRNVQISPLKPNTSASDHQNNLNIVVDKLYAMCKIVAYLINPFLYRNLRFCMN